MLKLKHQHSSIIVIIITLISCLWIIYHLFFSTTTTKSNSKIEEKIIVKKEYSIHIHSTDTFIPASKFSGQLKKPLELGESNIITCPDRGGKNTQCGKVSSEYRFQIKESGDYFLYIQVIAPDLNGNSLWIGIVDEIDEDTFDNCENPLDETGPLIPHKHLTSSKKILCCPAYLAKNKKKGLAGFYSDCCYSDLGKESNEKGCVLDLEVDETMRWNQVPRIFRINNANSIAIIRIYAREDGTSWSGLVLSSKSNLDEKAISKFKKSTA